jgi:formylglycine-generating enzyme required for sulfatase activity
MTVRCGCTALVIALAGGCATAPRTVQQGEAIVVVDTDAPVPALVARLRVDLYTTDGTWYATRDSSLANEDNWPTSFAVALDDGVASKDVVVRLRAYPEGATRDYAGERFQQRATACDVPSCFGGQPDPCCPLEPAPVLAPVPEQYLSDANGQDITPPTEPLPLETIDRLLLVHLEAGMRGTVSVVLAGACFGTMSDLRDLTQLSTCVDTENTRTRVMVQALEPGTVAPSPSVSGQFGQEYTGDCTAAPRTGGQAADGTPLHDDEVCVRGGAFVFGGRDDFLGQASDSLPARVALVPSFLMDRQEVTVARFRAALQSGFSGAADANDGPLGGYDAEAFDISMCTFSTAPMGREEYPLSCVSAAVARAFCRQEGGDLPTEAQWEYAAAASDRPGKTHFSMGDDAPACDVAVYGRGTATYDTTCDPSGLGAVGPAAVTVADHPGGDVTPGLSIANLTGSVAEWTVDTFAPFTSNCWMATGLLMPSCSPPGSGDPGVTSTVRGSSWLDGGNSLVAEWRDSAVTGVTSLGFRCVRGGG